MARPSQSELWRRQQLALALVAEAGPDVLDQVRRVLGGEMLADGAA
ncbi:MAG TPA: hypothetical protein VHX38_02405 [Pseudonocardiaceae bacterium]|nr:hypothetical protein [Pseudonocardiaceae bacterium]